MMSVVFEMFDVSCLSVAAVLFLGTRRLGHAFRDA